MKLIKFIVPVFAFTPLTSLAITNIESQNFNKPEQGLQGGLELSISGKSGNSNKQTNSLSSRLSYRSGANQLLTILKSEYGSSNKTKDSDNNFVHQRYIHHNSDSFAFECFLQYQDDTFKLLESRTLLGAGARFTLSKSESQIFIFGLGAYYTEEIYDISKTITLNDDYARASSYINYSRQLTANTTLSNTLYWQPKISQPSDSYIYNSLGISVKINSALALKVSLETQYDSMPVNNLKTTDTSYFTSLEYSF